MFKFLKKIFGDSRNEQFLISKPPTTKPYCIPSGQGIKNNHPPLLDGKPNEIVLKQKFNRDSKGRFAKKG